MKYIIGHRDSSGRQFWRGTDPLTIPWYPFRHQAEIYDFAQAVGVARLIDSLEVGESIIVERVV